MEDSERWIASGAVARGEGQVRTYGPFVVRGRTGGEAPL